MELEVKRRLFQYFLPPPLQHTANLVAGV